jgi:hypothetical protein
VQGEFQHTFPDESKAHFNTERGGHFDVKLKLDWIWLERTGGQKVNGIDSNADGCRYQFRGAAGRGFPDKRPR